jgi:hypothetical protein
MDHPVLPVAFVVIRGAGPILARMNNENYQEDLPLMLALFLELS